MTEYMVLMRESDNAWENLGPEQQQALLKRYFAWVDQLRGEQVFVGGNPLGGGGRLLRMVDGEVVDGPFTETKEVLTGYFIIQAPDWEAAVKIASGCPALTHGETVELREIAGH